MEPLPRPCRAAPGAGRGLARAVPRQAVDTVARAGRLLLSIETLSEVDDVLRRPKFDRYVTGPTRLEFLWNLVELAEIVPISHAVSECRDPKDNKFLELAVAGRASHLLSGDSDLLALHPFRGIAIVRSEDFLRSWRV